jgi:hypothetical protein
MRFQIFSRDLLIGSSELEHLDPPMGIASGLFSPAEDDQRVQPVFRIYSEACLNEANQSSEMFDRYYRERDAPNLTVRLHTGETVPVQCVHIEDCFAEEEDTRVTVAMFDSLAFDQYFEN